MWRRIGAFLGRMLGTGATRWQDAPGWGIGPGPAVGEMPPYVPPPLLPEGMACPWGLGCRCGLCLRDVPLDVCFASRITDADAPRAYWR